MKMTGRKIHGTDFPMRYDINFDRKLVNLRLENGKGRKLAVCDGKDYSVSVKQLYDNHLLLRLNGKNYDIRLEGDEDRQHVNVNGKQCTLSLLDSRIRKLRRISKAETNTKNVANVKAPMPGLVLRVLVKEGDEIKVNDSLAIIEAMKMENEIKATSAGVVKKINVEAGQAVDKGILLLRVE